jgi:hypothetical protein
MAVHHLTVSAEARTTAILGVAAFSLGVSCEIRRVKNI